MPQHLHTIETYQDPKMQWRWRIMVTPGTPAGTRPDVICSSSEGYANKKDMLTSLFGMFFGSYDETYLELYAEWNPDGDRKAVSSDEVVGDDKPELPPANGVPSVEEQAGAVADTLADSGAKSSDN